MRKFVLACLVLLFCLGSVCAAEVGGDESFWDKVTYFFRSVFSTFTGKAIVGVSPVPATGEWWNSSWHYRVGVEVGMNGLTRSDWPVEVEVDFRSELDVVGDSSALDFNSVRVFEYDSGGHILWEVRSDFEVVSGESGNVIFILNGTTPSGEVRDFLIYFDSVDRSKVAAGYTSSINYNSGSDEFSFDNGVFDFSVDDSRGEGSSGIYRAERVDSGKVIFDVDASERTVEYLEYYDGSSYYGVDFGGSSSLEFDGALKKTVLQSGNEVAWGTTTSTGNEFFKRYTVYEGLPWIFIEHVFRNNDVGDVSRRTDYVGAPAMDVDRAYGFDNLIGPGGAGADPFSWKSTTKTVGAFGIGIINYEEQGTSNYYVQGSVFSGQIGVQLDTTTISSGGEISSKVVIYFNDENNHDVVQDLKDRLQSPASLSLGSGEEYDIVLNLSAEFALYNLNDDVLIRMEVLTDSHDLVRAANVTLDMGTGSVADDVVLELFDDGVHDDGLANDSVYGGRYTIGIGGIIGAWGIGVEVFDKYYQDVGMDSYGFDVSDKLNGDLNVLNPVGLGGREVVSTYILENVRNDSMVSGVVTCDYNGTNVVDIVESSAGNYTVKFNAIAVIGNYELVCLGSVSGNSGSGSDWFYVEPDKTTIDFDFVPLSEVVSGVTQTVAANFSIGVNVTNIGGGFSSGVNISVIIPNGDFVSNVSEEECGAMSIGENCSKAFFVDVFVDAVPGDYNLTINVSWINPDLSLNYSEENLGVTVESNPIFDLSGFVFDEDVGEGENGSVVNFSVDSVGNTEILNVLLSCASGIVCSDFNVSIIPDNFSSVLDGSSSDVEIKVEVPEGYSPGIYGGVVGVGTLNAGIKSFGFNVSVAERRTWDVSRLSCNGVVLVESAGEVCEIEVNNSGNVELNFSILPVAGNYTFVSPDNFSLAKQSNSSFFVLYNTTGSPPNENFEMDYLVSVDLGEPGARNIDVSLLVVFGPEVWVRTDSEVEQAGSFLIEANISDRSLSGIEWVWVNVTWSDGGVDVVNLSNVSIVGVGGYSDWEVLYTDTLRRGNYSVEVFARDQSGGMGWDEEFIMVYAKLNVSLRTGWEDYLLGESGTIYYSVEDLSGDGLVGEVNISVRDSEGFVRYYEEVRTNTLGGLDVLPSFGIPNDAVVGAYVLESETSYDDVISGKVISGEDNDSFSVFDHLFISLDTSVTWYPDSVMAFYVLAFSTGDMGGSPSEVNLVVYDPAQAEYITASLGDFNIVSQTNSSILYLYKYAMPANSPTGDFLARVEVKEGSRSFQDVQSFRVSSGGPFDLILLLNVTEAVRGETVPFEILMKNMGEVPQDVYLDYWVSDIDGNNFSKVTGEAIFVDAMGNTTISRTLPIFDWQDLGEHILYVTMDYSSVIGPITTSKNFFVVEGDDNETEPVEPEVPSSGGGGGSSVTGEVIVDEKLESLIILDVDPDELEIERGGFTYLMVEMKNNMDWDLVKVAGLLSVEGREIGVSGVLDLLPMGEKVVLPVRISIPEDFDSGFYDGELRVYSGSIEYVMDYKVNVFDSKDELLAHRKSRLEDRLENLRVRVINADDDGFDVGEIFDSIQRVGLDFDLFDERLKDRKYLESLGFLDRIENDIETAEYELDGIVAVDVSWTWLVWVLVIGILILLILIVAILIWKFRKVLGRMRFEVLRRKYRKNRKNRKKIEKVVKAAVFGKDEDYLKTLEEQYRYGYISKAAYDEARRSV